MRAALNEIGLAMNEIEAFMNVGRNWRRASSVVLIIEIVG